MTTTRRDIATSVTLALNCNERGADKRAARAYAAEARGLAADFIVGGGDPAVAGAELAHLRGLRFAWP